MFNMVYILSFLAVVLALMLWTSFNRGKADRILRGITILALLTYLGSWLVQVAPIDYKLEVLVRDLLVIAASGAVFSFVAQKRKLFVLLLAITIGAGYWYYKTQLTQSFPYQIPMSEMTIDKQGELLVELKHQLSNNELVSLNSWMERNRATYKRAFQDIENPEMTELVDFIVTALDQFYWEYQQR